MSLRAWLQAPEPKGRYYVYLAVVLFALLLIGDGLFSGADAIVRLVGSVLCFFLAHGFVRFLMLKMR